MPMPAHVTTQHNVKRRGEPGGTDEMRADPRARSSSRDERGAAAVELGIVLSVLFLFVFGVIQFGIAFNRNQGLQAAAREGARIASIGGTEAEIKARVQNAQSLFAIADIRIAIDYSTDDGAGWSGSSGGSICADGSSTPCTSAASPTPCTGRMGSLVRVTATVPAMNKYAIIIPVWGNHDITFSAAGVFRCEASS
jgi:Flp pilus assembly protein TadG